MKQAKKFFGFVLVFSFLGAASAFSGGKQPSQTPASQPIVSAKSAVIMNSKNGGILYSKNPHLKLPPASTTKLMTVLIALEKLSLDKEILISRNAYNVSPSKAGFNRGERYRAGDVIAAALISSSNDAAVALAEAISGSESAFSELMNQKAVKLGMEDTHFVNATGLTDKSRKNVQYSTAFDLARLMYFASKDKRIDYLMGIREFQIKGSDGKVIVLRSHNKMLWKIPQYVKGKTGWTFAAKHTFVGTNYDPHKHIFFAMLASQKPWTDIEKLTTFGLEATSRNKSHSFWNIFSR